MEMEVMNKEDGCDEGQGKDGEQPPKTIPEGRDTTEPYITPFNGKIKPMDAEVV